MAFPAAFFNDDEDDTLRDSAEKQSPSPADDGRSQTTTISSRIFNVYHTWSFQNFIVTVPDKTPVCYVNNSIFTPGKPDLTLHAGADAKGPILAVCKFVLFSTGLKIGLGDPKDPNAVTWEDVTRESRDHSRYRFEMTIYPSRITQNIARNGEAGERRAFLWKRTHSVGVEDSKPWMISPCNFKMVEERTGELVAVFANNGFKSLKKKGKIEIVKAYGKDFDTAVILTGLAMVEKERRRSSQWRYDQL
jgi:hypothetical protein